jgi:WD40 repeat protein
MNNQISMIKIIIAISMIILGCGKSDFMEEYFPESSLAETSSINHRGIFLSDHSNQTPEIYVQMGHVSGTFNYTNAVQFADQGNYIFSGNGDGTIILWETQTGREVKTFRCDDDVTHLDISADGKYLVSGDMGFTNYINLWDIASGKKIKSFSSAAGKSSNGYPVLFCNNDKSILSGGGEGILSLWDVGSGKLIREFKADYGASEIPDVSSIALTPDGKSIVAGYRYNGQVEIDGVLQDATSGDLNTIKIWDIDSGREISSFNKGNGWVEALSITPDGRFLLSGDWQQDSVRVWDLKTGKQSNAFYGRTSAIDVSAGGRYALLGGSMRFRLIEIPTGKEIRRINKGIDGWVRSIKFSPDGRFALVGDNSSKPMFWDLESATIITEFGGYTNQLETAKLSKTGNVMLTADDYNDVISIWDYHNGRLLKTIARDSGSIMSSAAISSDGTLMATGGWNGRTSNAIIWDIASSKKIMPMELEEESGQHTQFLQITDDNNYLIWATQENIVISEIRSGKEITKISGFSFIYEKIIVEANGKYLLIPSYDGGTKLFSFPDGRFIKLLSEGDEINTITGEEYLYEFKSVRDGYAGRQRFLTIYDRATLKEKSRKKVKDVYYNFGIGYKSDQLFFCYNFATDIAKYDISKDKIVATFSGHKRAITNLDMTPDGKFLCSGSIDGTTRFWDTETGKEVAQFISFKDGEWIVITPKGYFNASPNGAKYINVKVGNQVYSIDNFHEKYFNPAYVASVLQGKTVETTDDIRKGITPPPLVQIRSPHPNTEFKEEEITITISAADMGGGIDEIRLYHNGKVVSEETRGMKPASQRQEISAPVYETEAKKSADAASTAEITKSYSVILVDGINTFRAIGFSRDRTESNPAEVLVRLTGGSKSVSLHVFTVGINNYENPALNLNYAQPDAKGIVEFFQQSAKGLFKNVNITDIYNEQATKAGILSNLGKLKNTEPQDAVLIFLAGHGENIDDKWYFIPHELRFPEREEEIKSKGISSDELSEYIRNINAQKILLLIDACKSGAALIAFRGFEDRKALAQLSRATGVHVVAASTKDQFATEVKELGHGVFTYTLLEGLKGKAAAKGETITVRKLMGHIEEELPELTKKYRQEAQFPVVNSKGMDFPLVINR